MKGFVYIMVVAQLHASQFAFLTSSICGVTQTKYVLILFNSDEIRITVMVFMFAEELFECV